MTTNSAIAELEKYLAELKAEYVKTGLFETQKRIDAVRIAINALLYRQHVEYIGRKEK